MDRLYIKPKYFNMLIDIFKSYCPQAEIWAYGSRIKNEAHDGSDLDLVVKNFNSDDKYLYELREILQESNIPFLTDIHEFDNLPKSFQDEILKDYIKIFPIQK